MLKDSETSSERRAAVLQFIDVPNARLAELVFKALPAAPGYPAAQYEASGFSSVLCMNTPLAPLKRGGVMT